MFFLVFQLRNGRVERGPDVPEVVVSSGTIRRGGSIYKSLVKVGIPDLEIYEIIKSLRPLYNPKRSKPGDLYQVYLSTSGEFLSMNYWEDRVQYYKVVKTTQGMHSTKEQVPMSDVTMSAMGTIKSSLWEAMSSQGISDDLIYRFVEIYAWQIDFLTEPRKGDRFKVIWKRKESEDGFVVEGDIKGAYYEGEETGDIAAIRFRDRYYMPDGKSLERRFLRTPLRYRRISSYFSKGRYHPILRRYRPHHGIDYAAPSGTPVSSVGNGKVIFKGWKGGYGRMIKIRHRNSQYTSVYAHLFRYRKGIRVGSNVKQGQLIGRVGSSGLSTGPHLHFEVQKNGKSINFLRLKLPPARRITDKGELKAFAIVKNSILSYFDRIVTVDGKPVALMRRSSTF